MRTIRSGDFKGERVKALNIGTNDIIEGGEFTQEVPRTMIGEGARDVVVRGGIFRNCVPGDPSWQILGGDWSQDDQALFEDAPNDVNLDMDLAEDGPARIVPPPDPLACPYCDFVAKSKGGLTTHVNRKHG